MFRAEHLNKKNGTALNVGGKAAAPLVNEKSSFIYSAINVPKRKDVLEADRNRDVESLPLALRRYGIYVKYALTDHYYCIRLSQCDATLYSCHKTESESWCCVCVQLLNRHPTYPNVFRSLVPKDVRWGIFTKIWLTNWKLTAHTIEYKLLHFSIFYTWQS